MAAPACDTDYLAEQHSPRAAKILAGLDAELAAASKATGQTMVWTGPELEARALIVDNCARADALTEDWAAATTAAARVKISAELRQLEIVRLRLLKQFKAAVEIPQPESLRSVKARRAARARWDHSAS